MSQGTIRINRRKLLGLAAVSLSVLGVALALTWQHWWWSVPRAHVFADGKPIAASVYRGKDGMRVCASRTFLKPLVIGTRTS